MKHTKRAAGALAVLVLMVSSCADDRLIFDRGPLGPASYEVSVEAFGDVEGFEEERQASLDIVSRGRGATFTLRTPGGGVITAEMLTRADGSLDLTRIRGVPVEGSGQTELASLVGQLDPPLPDRPVRIGDRWSATKRITTGSLRADIETTLRLGGFRRVASTDAAELVGEVTGTSLVAAGAGALAGQLAGTTRILWAVESGRVLAATTELEWTLEDGSSVVIHTEVHPR